ncbi:MAG: SMP-30/gluconolactonase/LRE family protein [Opitutaceae bacterium]
MPLFIRIFLLAALTSSPAIAAWTISTFAGTGVMGFSGDGGPATAAQINDPYGIVRGPDGAIWFCERNGHRIRRVAADGTITTVVGTGKSGYSGDGGPAAEATLNQPHELRFDAQGNIFIADMSNQVVRRVDAKTKVITTVAGTGKKGYAGDGGPAQQALLDSPHSIQFGADGSLYICDVSNHAIRRVDLGTGLISALAGTGRPGPTPDGAPISGTPLNNPRSLDVDREGNLWLVTREGNQVLKLDLKAGKILHIAGTGEPGFTGNGGPAKLAKLSAPKGIALDRAGNAWLADTESHTLRMINARTGNIELIAGTGEMGNGDNPDPLKTAMNRLHGVFVDADGSVFIGDSEAHRVRVLRER